MPTSLRLQLTAFTALALGTAIPDAANAAVFNQQEINQGNAIAIAAPYNNGKAHQLLILEQTPGGRSCWSESGANPTMVDPLLLTFDFTGICNRSTDSNGYSIRTAGQDLGWRYGLRLVQRQNELVLVAFSNTDRSAPEIEIGRTNGLSSGFSKIVLDPGWRLTKRSFNGQTQGHFYLTNERAIDTLLADASTVQAKSTTSTRPSSGVAPRPVVSTPPASNPPAVEWSRSPSSSASRPSSAPAVVVPTVPVPPRVPPTAPTRPSTPPTTSGRPLPPVVVSPTPSTNSSNSASRPILSLPSGSATEFNYRVIVAARTLAEQNRVRSLVPGAFRTTVNGQSVMQAGLFQELNKANEVYQTLVRNNLQASVVPIRPGEITRPTTPPVTTPRPVPNSRVVIAIDPGHGGGDPGAVGIGGLQEKNAVLSISQQVVSFLSQEGIQAVLTRSGDQEIDLEPRVQSAEQANADVFVSIHANSISMSRPDINGLETYHYSASGQRLAQVIHNAILQDVGMRDRGVRKANFYVIKNTPMPAVLVEVGFVTGSEDAARLSSSTGRTQLAKAIARGIAQYVRANL